MQYHQASPRRDQQQLLLLQQQQQAPPRRDQQQQKQQSLLHPVQAQCLASEAALRRGDARLLAQVAGSDLLVAATGSCLLLLSATAEAVRPLASLHEGGDASIAAVAVSSVGGRQRQWAAVLEGGAATFVPVDSSGADAACYGGGPEACAASVRPAEGSPGLDALAWHPWQPVCALLAPHELLLVAPDGAPHMGSGGDAVGGAVGASSGSEDEDEDGSAAKLQTWGTWRSGTVGGSSLRGDWGSMSGGPGGSGSGAVLLALPAPTGSGGRGAAGRCCLAWLGACSSGDGEPTEAQRQLVVSWGGGHLELLAFDTGWLLQDRRQLLPGLPGPVCSLVAAGPDCLLAATERPMSHWLSSGGAAGEDAESLQPGVLQRGLSARQASPPPVLLPRPSWSPGTVVDVAPPAQAAPSPAAGSAASSPDGGGGGGIVELSAPWHSGGADPTNPFLSPPTAPPGPPGPIPAMFLLQQPWPSSGPLAAGLPRLPGTPPGAAQPGPMTPLQQHLGEAAPAMAAGGVGTSAAEGGHAALLWFGSPAGSPGGAAAPSPAGSPREQQGVRLGMAAGLLQVQGNVAVLASSKAPPLLLLCRLSRGGLQQTAAIPLAPPAGVPDGCTLRLRGLAVRPAAGGDAAALEAWVLLAAAQPGAAAPFLSAALSSQLYGSSKQQLWLCCYRLPLPAPPAPPSSAAVSVAATVPAAAAPAAAAAQAAPAAAPPATAVDAVLSLQDAVANLRAATNAQLDELEERLAALLAALRPPSAR